MNVSMVLLFMKVGSGLLGVLFLGLAIGIQIHDQGKRRSCTRRVSATVVDMERSESCSSDGIRMTSWYPIYEYSIDGIKIRKRSRIGNATELFYIGQKISMYVNPKNVNEFYCPEEKTILVVKVFAVIGVLLLLYLVVLLVLGATIVSCGLG